VCPTQKNDPDSFESRLKTFGPARLVNEVAKKKLKLKDFFEKNVLRREDGYVCCLCLKSLNDNNNNNCYNNKTFMERKKEKTFL